MTAATRRSVGSQTLLVGVGLLVLGVSSYGFLALAARAIGPERFAGLSVLWTLVYMLGPGLFLPLEQEVGRAVAARQARGVGAAPVVRRALLVGTGLLAAVIAVCVALAPVAAGRLFGGDLLLMAALAVALAAALGSYLTRGVMAGAGHFRPYAAQLAVEGVVRLLACAALALLAVPGAGAYGLVLALAPVAALVVTVGAVPRPVPGPPAPLAEVSRHLGLLLGASLLAQALINAGPVAVKLLEPDRTAAGRFLAGFVIARVPLFLFAALQAALLPGLAHAVGAGDRARFRRELVRALALVSLVAGAGVAGSAAVGPQVLHLLFGPDFALTRVDLVLLAASAGAYMFAVVFQPALVALRRHRANAGGWVLGTATFLALCALPLRPVLRVEVALLVGSAVVAVALGAALVTTRRTGEVDEDGEVEAVTGGERWA